MKPMIAYLLFTMVAVIGATSCQSEGPAEKRGNEIDHSVENSNENHNQNRNSNLDNMPSE